MADHSEAAAPLPAEIRIVPLRTIPEVQPGAGLAGLIAEAAGREGVRLESGCAVVVAQKVVSKAEGRLVRLAGVQPSAMAETIAREQGKDPRLVEVILGQSRRIVRMDRGVLIVETHQGLVCANAGVDASNVPADADGAARVTLLPCDPDASARRLREELLGLTGAACAVIVSDTFGRPWRDGLVNVAIGAAGFPALLDHRGQRDRDGRTLTGTVVALADELAAAAGLVMDKAAGVPVVVIHGARWPGGDGRAADIIRPPDRDLFR